MKPAIAAFCALPLALAACGGEGGGADTAPAEAWTVDYGQSALTFSSDYAGTPFEGRFQDWSADIVFSPDDVEASSIRAEIQTGSIESGDGTRDDAAVGSQWLKSEEFPTAVYEAGAGDIAEAEDGGYVAHGELTVVGVTTPLDLFFTVDIEGDTATASATTDFDHHDIGVTGGYYDEDAGDMYEIRIDIVATRAGE